MGNFPCCGISTFERFERETMLKDGDTFIRKTTLFGLLPQSEKVHLYLNATSTRLEWTPVDDPSDVARTEAIHLAHVAKIHESGKMDMIMYGASGKKLLEIQAKHVEVRDRWVHALNDILKSQGVNYTTAELKSVEAEVDKQRAKDKEEYWRERTRDLERRQSHAVEKKKAFANVGMRFTAQAMANR